MSGDKKLVLIPMVADYLHYGHINIINIGKKYGEVYISLMTDEAAASYKRLPLLNYDERKSVLEAIDGVSKVVPQERFDYVFQIEKYKPDYFIHGTDWRTGVQKRARERVFIAMEKISGTVIEPEYTKGISSTDVTKQILASGISPDRRLEMLRKLLNAKKYLRGIEAHNGLTGLIAETVQVDVEGASLSYDFLWLSSLTDSTAKGKPDIELVDSTSRMQTLQDILEVTTKPIIYDADTGGRLEHFPYLVSSLSRLGVSACVIEDKTGLKRNSLFGSDVPQLQEDAEVFAKKITQGKQSACNPAFMVIARIESLILGAGIEDAIHRAKVYISAGADAIMIHSRNKTVDEIKLFCDHYNKISNRPPLVVVPSSFNTSYEGELSEMGANVIIYANQLLRSAYPSMVRCAQSILQNGRSYESDKEMMSINEVINLIPGTNL